MQQATRAQLKRIGRAIRDGRASIGLSQEDFAEQCDVHRTYMGHIERGEANLTFESLAKVARALRTKPSVLFAKAGL